MSANLIIPTFEGKPLDEVRITFSEGNFHLPESNLELKYPPFLGPNVVIDHPNVHNRTQKGEYYPRNKIYNGNLNYDSNFTDGHSECRNKDLSENAVLPSIKIDPKYIIHRSKFNK